ncbi:permeases of the major facilitator superfamily [Stylonychia lemnae]|uniref:Permeases of the major facilitator superfamily n=1 Tax=Stylonychia lemnae TaxID=5949 RepID=A0A078AZW8_STYLE|nr:permeases of the major facilitator superfamily [Stylonychia lemnae]|eukprot:CDW87636.1 permeases of the major facilitator superfamily [Stylonychia lemnae]
MKPSSLRSYSVAESQKSNSERKDSITTVQQKTLSTVQKAMTRQDKAILIVILFSIFVSWTLYGNIATFYPPYRLEKHKSLSDTQVGIVLSQNISQFITFSMFEVGVLISSPIIAIVLPKIGRKNSIIIGQLTCISASIGFGLLVFISDELIQGIGDACISNAGLSIISSEFPSKREHMYGYAESSIGAGLMIGPVIGQALYSILDFEYTFFCSAAIVGTSLILTLVLIPQRINNTSSNERDSITSSQRAENDKRISYKMMIKNKRVMIACISVIIAMVFMLFFETILADQLLAIGVSKDHVGNLIKFDFKILRLGYIYSIMSLVYTVFSPFVGFFCDKLKKIYITQFSFFLATIALIFYGPSKLLGLPGYLYFKQSQIIRTLPFMIVGMILLGFACPLIIVPLLPEIIDAVKEKEQIGENNELNDKASSFFNSSVAIGSLTAPILGGLFNDLYDFRNTCDIMAIMSCAYAIIFFLINLLPFWISLRNSKQTKRKLYKNFDNSTNQNGDYKTFESEKWQFTARSKVTKDESFNNQLMSSKLSKMSNEKIKDQALFEKNEKTQI